MADNPNPGATNPNPISAQAVPFTGNTATATLASPHRISGIPAKVPLPTTPTPITPVRRK